MGLGGPSPGQAGKARGLESSRQGTGKARENRVCLGGPGTCERRWLKEQRGPQKCCMPQRPKEGEPESHGED